VPTPGTDTRSPRILHVIGSFDGGGAERVLLTVLHGLPGGPQALAVGAEGSLLPLVPGAVPVFRAATERELAEVMADWRPDVVHTWLDGSLLTAIVPAAHLGIPLVHRLYNISSAMAAHDDHGARHHRLMSRALQTATRVCALSSAAADDAVAYYGIARPQVITNGFPLAGARRNVSRPARPADGSVLLAVGRLSPEKGHAVLIEAMARLAGRHPAAELWIAGVGAGDGQLRELAQSLGLGARVTFLGFCEDVSSLHAAADIFVCPSLTEGFGNAVAEAAIAGMPLVASDLPAIRTDVLAGQPAALFVPPGDVEALAAALDRALSDLATRASLAEATHAVADRLRVDRMLEDYRALYASVVEDACVAA